jgi:hypothetical protein
MDTPDQEPLPEKTRKPRKPDPDGEEWFAEAGKRWTKARSDRPDLPIEAYEAPPLPKWSAATGVTRELFGRYLEDRETGLVHDVQHAVEECAIDSILNATFYHFESELPVTAIDHAACMEA